MHTPSGPQNVTIINESGLYSLILTSRKPEAKRFVLADVCRVLEISNSRDAASRLDPDEKADVGITDTSSSGARDIQKMAMELSTTFGEKSEPSTGGRPSVVYLLPKRETLILVSGYSMAMRAGTSKKWGRTFPSLLRERIALCASA